MLQISLVGTATLGFMAINRKSLQLAKLNFTVTFLMGLSWCVYLSVVYYKSYKDDFDWCDAAAECEWDPSDLSSTCNTVEAMIGPCILWMSCCIPAYLFQRHMLREAEKETEEHTRLELAPRATGDEETDQPVPSVTSVERSTMEHHDKGIR